MRFDGGKGMSEKRSILKKIVAILVRIKVLNSEIT